MKLLVVDHNAIDPTYRTLYARIAGTPDIELKLIVPRRWHDGYRMLVYEPPAGAGALNIASLPVLFATRTHRLLYIGLAKLIHNYRPDIFYMNAEPENFQTWQAAGIAARYPRMRFVCSSWRNIDHAIIGYPYKFGAIHRRIEREVHSRTDALVCFTRTGELIFRRHGFDRGTYIPPAIDLHAFNIEAASKNKSTGSPFVMGFAGRCVHEKGVDILLRAAAELRFDYRILIIGDGPRRPQWQQLAEELGLANRVQWIGAIARESMARYLAELDILILPSRTSPLWKEQFGRILAEAMAAGVPVIGSDSGEIPDVIGDAGLLFKEGDAHDLATKILFLHDHIHIREELSEKGIRRCAEEYSIGIQATRYIHLFRNLLATGKQAGGS